MDISHWDNIIFYGNPLKDLSFAAGIFLVSVVILMLTKRFFKYEKSKIIENKSLSNTYRELIFSLFSNTRFFFIIMVGLFASQYILTLPPKIDKVFNNIFIISFFIQLLIWGNQLVKFSLIKLLTKDHKKPNAKVLETLPVLTIVSKFVLFTIILLLALDNLGFNVSTLVASLGIGGIAIALALQNVLGDLFASLSIVLDKPFKVGDFIILDNYLGSIEKIGLKSTHIRSLGGEQIICSNTDLLKSRIRNYQRMDQRRVVFEFGIIYQTSNEILHSIAERVKKIINNIERTRFDRAHFKNFGDSSLNFEVVYYVLSPDFNIYMDIQQSINLELHRQFEKDGIDFAYPTRTIYMEGSKN